MKRPRGLVRAALIILIVVSLPARGEAQSPEGRIVGRVLDAQTGRALVGARVTVQGAAAAAISGVEGRYTLTPLPLGTYAVTASMLGYGVKTVTGVVVRDGSATNLDISLASRAIALQAISVSARRERGSIARALDEQRNAVGIVSATTSEQIARSPDGDAARAVRRISGVTVQDGKYVVVRGLGERYTTTSLNGARIPSPEPEKRIVPLDLFPSTLLDAITTYKTFTPDQPGDFTGAQVDLRTRSFPTRRTLTYSLATSYNLAALGDDVLRAPRAGGEWVADAADARRLPSVVAAARFDAGSTSAPVNPLIRSFRTTWWAEEARTQPSMSTSLSVGGQDPILGRPVGYVGSLTYSRGQSVRLGSMRSAVGAGSGGVPVARDVFTGRSGEESVLLGALLNLSTLVRQRHKIELNNTFDRSADNTARVEWGSREGFDADSLQATELRYVERTVRSNQLRVAHALPGSATLDWSVTSSAVRRREPDRSDIVYGYERNPVTGGRLPFAWLGLPNGSTRSFGDLTESAFNADLNLRLFLGPQVAQRSLKIGGAYRATHRNADSRAYDIGLGRLSIDARQLPPSTLFDGRFTSGPDSAMTLTPNLNGGYYTARDFVGAGYAMAELPFGDRLRLVAGARVEHWRLNQTVEDVSGVLTDVARTNTDVLPSLALNVQASETQALRFAVTQTLARPEYRELAAVQQCSAYGDLCSTGNPDLVRTLVRNFDARWEWYPNPGEIVSASVFAKEFRHPIEQVEIATTGAPLLGFANAAGATNYGVEAEVRKGLDFLTNGLAAWTVFANGTLMRSEIRAGGGAAGSTFTNPRRPMVGQAPYVLNAGVSYARQASRTSATILYNVVGKRIRAAAIVPITVDTYEMPRQSLDVSLRFGIGRNLAAKIDAANLLDSQRIERQGTLVRRRYTTGRTLGFGFTWQTARPN